MYTVVMIGGILNISSVEGASLPLTVVRSLGGWDEIKKMRLTSQDRIKGDQHILGESDFVLGVLSESGEKFERKHRLQSLGYDFDKTVERVSSLFDLEEDYITARGRQKERVEARDLLCYWSAIELGIPMVDLAKRLEMTLSGVSYAVQRGEKMAKGNGHQLEN